MKILKILAIILLIASSCKKENESNITIEFKAYAFENYTVNIISNSNVIFSDQLTKVNKVVSFYCKEGDKFSIQTIGKNVNFKATITNSFNTNNYYFLQLFLRLFESNKKYVIPMRIINRLMKFYANHSGIIYN